jgi:O-antigen/teichoic acid export membrane protein
VGTSVVINLVGGIAVTAISALFLLPLFEAVLHSENVLHYVVLTCAAATFNCLAFHLMAYYRAGYKGLQVTVSSLAAAGSLVLLTVIFLRVLHMNVEGALLAQAIIYALLSGFFLWSISRRMTLSVSLPLMWSLMRFGLPLIVVMGGGLMTQASAFYFLSYFRGLGEVGIYSLGLKIAQIVEMILILPFEMAYEPFVYGHIGDSRLWKAISRLLTYIIVAFAFVACGIAFIARDMVSLIAPPEFSPAYGVIFLVLPALAFRAVYYVGESLLFLEKRTDLAGSVVTAFTALSVVLNYFFIRSWGMHGAAAVFILTTVLTGATVMKLGLRTAPVRIERDRLSVATILLFGLLATVYTLGEASKYVYYSVVPAVVCLGTVLLYASNFIKEDERRVIQAFVGRAQRFKSVLGV